MILVISNPTPVEQEHTYINSLFDAGVPIFHLRKPGYSLKEVAGLLQKINTAHYSKISLHQHHELAADYDITRFHYPEAQRLEKFSNDDCRSFKKEVIENRVICSTSIHTTTTYELLTDFEYCFLSPLFKSISKHTEHTLLSSGFNFPPKTRTKLIGLGGICQATINQVKAYPFDGIALLGCIWSVPENALSTYKKIKQQWNS